MHLECVFKVCRYTSKILLGVKLFTFDSLFYCDRGNFHIESYLTISIPGIKPQYWVKERNALASCSSLNINTCLRFKIVQVSCRASLVFVNDVCYWSVNVKFIVSMIELISNNLYQLKGFSHMFYTKKYQFLPRLKHLFPILFLSFSLLIMYVAIRIRRAPKKKPENKLLLG